MNTWHEKQNYNYYIHDEVTETIHLLEPPIISIYLFIPGEFNQLD